MAAYAVVHPERPQGDVGRATDGRVLLVKASGRSDLVGRWFLPGGGVDHGEHPDEAVVREVQEETGLQVRVRRLRDVLTDVVDLPHRGLQVHTVRLVYDVEVTGGRLRPEAGGSSEELMLVGAGEAATLSLAPYVARVLGLPPVELGPLEPDLAALTPLSGVADLVSPAETADGVDVADGVEVPDGVEAAATDPTTGPEAAAGNAVAAFRRLRVGVYGVARAERAGRTALLLARLADHVAGRPMWTLPGGGLDHGETTEAGLRRELHEETGLDLLAATLLGVSSSHFTGRSPAGVVEDFHGIRVVYRVDVGEGEPRVLEVDGSTVEARWVPVDPGRPVGTGRPLDEVESLGAPGLPLTGLVAEALAMERARTIDV